MRGYRGVSRSKNGFVVRLRVKDKRLFIGRYDRLEDACDAYDRACREHYGVDAIVNFPR